MSRLHTAFILGYHGCDAATAEEVLAGRTVLASSTRDYDWLGPGIYFWEADPRRAWEWAEWKVSRGAFAEPAVVGAIIDLGNCLDLMARDNLELLVSAHESLTATHDADPSLGPLPQNKKAYGADEDHLLRYLDCAVIRRLHASMEDGGETAFDTVRGLFTESAPLFPGSGFRAKTHVQVAVCRADSIKGYFRVAEPF
jgi:hypothetical protein